MEQPRRLYRSSKSKIIGGVCGGMGDYFNIDPVILRLLWVILTFAGGAGVLIYIVAWIIIPEEPVSRAK
jgi:phage shock protein PspC (stress-responsive transcriptional regulator)